MHAGLTFKGSLFFETPMKKRATDGNEISQDAIPAARALPDRGVARIADAILSMTDGSWGLSAKGTSDVKKLLRVFTANQIISALYISLENIGCDDFERYFKYACGVLWREKEENNREPVGIRRGL